MTDLLLVDDELAVRKGLGETLRGEGYSVRLARDGAEALSKIAEKRPDVVLLDVAMPKLNGFSTLTRIREIAPTLPVLFLTAHAEEVNEVRGLDVGADDFLSKDVKPTVLCARLRRAVERARETSPSAAMTLQIGKVRVEFSTFEVIGGSGEPLTRTEADILKLLSSDPDRYFTFDEIIEALRGTGFACEDGMLYSHVYNLRRKLGPAADAVVCRRRFGYRLVL